MNLPNKLTVIRVALIPFFLLALLWPNGGIIASILALIIFSVAAITDYFDGKIARARGLITDFGKLMDPLADKLLVIAAFIAFIQLGIADAIPIIIIIAREFLVTSVRMIALENNNVIAANNWGKAKTITQMITCIVILLFLIIEKILMMNIATTSYVGAFQFMTVASNVLIWLSALITFISGMTYVLENKHLFKDM